MTEPFNVTALLADMQFARTIKDLQACGERAKLAPEIAKPSIRLAYDQRMRKLKEELSL